MAGEIRRRIINGDVMAGDPLPNEAELTTLFGVSRPTLREALRLLESDGLIEVKRGVRGGPRVRVPDVGVTARHAALLLQMRGTTLEDLIGARMIVEPAAVRELARRASKADVKALREAHQTELDAGDDYDANAHHATLFHALLVELVGNQTLTLLNELLIGIQDMENRTVVDRLSDDEAARRRRQGPPRARAGDRPHRAGRRGRRRGRVDPPPQGHGRAHPADVRPGPADRPPRHRLTHAPCRACETGGPEPDASLPGNG